MIRFEILPPFYIGQEVVAVDAMDGSQIKNGQIYTISDCHYSLNNGRHYWYVGVAGINNNWMRPSIFAPLIPPMEAVSFEKIQELNPVSVN